MTVTCTPGTITTNGCNRSQSFTYSASGCNLTTTCTRTFTWTVDKTPPAMTVPSGGNLGCNPANPPTDASLKSQVTATDTCSAVTTKVTHVDTTNGCIITRTFTVTATDACNNATNKSVVYTWTADMTNPSITCPGPVTVCGFGNIPAPDTSKVSAGDTCSTPTKSFVSDTYVTNNGVITVTRTYRATDACSNSAACTQIITVNPIPPCSLAVPNPLPVADVSGYTLSGPAGNFLYSWSITATTDPNWQITSATNIQTITYTSGSSGTATFQLVVTDKATGCQNTCTVTFAVNTGGATPGFWGNPVGLPQVTAADFTALNIECLRNATGANQDFTQSKLADQQSAFATWLKNRNAVNMAYQFSAHLAAFTLNVRHKFICPATIISVPGCGGSMTATNLITTCNNALCADGTTFSGDPNRPTQECLKNALAIANGSTTTTAKTCP